EITGGYEKAKSFESGFQSNENDPFIIGKVAMKIDGDWVINSLSRFGPTLDIGVAPAPVPDDRYYRRGRFAQEKDQFVTWCGGHSFAIPTGARNPEGGWRFIKFVTSTEGRLIAAEAQRKWEQRRGREFIPAQSGSVEANEALFTKFKPASKKWANALRQHIDLMPHARIRPVTFVGQVLWNEHVRALENAAMGKMPPMEALQAGQVVVQQELDAVLGQERFPVIDSKVPLLASGALALATGWLVYFLYSRKRLGKLARHEARWAYTFIAPWLIGFVTFTLGPMIASFFLSFTQYNVLSPARWVGAKNYADMLTTDSEKLSKAFSNVLYLAGVGVPLGIITGLAVAMLLNSAVRGMRFYRTLFYMPSIVPTTASAVLWVWLLTPDPSKGLINSGWAASIGQWFDLAPPGWLNAEAWAKPSLILMGLWGAGSGMILWLAGLKGVPNQLYEAASIDGANPRQQFWAVTLPQLSPIIFFNLVMGFIGALQEFDRVYIMKPASEGSIGPADSLLMPVFHLFTNGFAYFKMGYASALAWLIFLIILIITGSQFWISRRWVHYEAER
ncbi:MAG TPA: extracellular solute-binding protein, partial [Fimbriimonadaceae bacterium]|nr:extracellular solute-binding protein [Fimbriimonadaceae bacterium]